VTPWALSWSVARRSRLRICARMRRMGQFVSKAELESALYDGETEIESNTIETAIYALRRKLGANLIVTARGLGYTIPRAS
jgi:two-component system OmpR family response regulator/two-component system response regulator QseB